MEIKAEKILYLSCMKIKLWNTQTYIIEKNSVIKNLKWEKEVERQLCLPDMIIG